MKLKIIDRDKFIVRIMELLTIILTVVLTVVSIKMANTWRGYIAFGGEYILPLFGTIIILVLETILEERKM